MDELGSQMSIVLGLILAALTISQSKALPFASFATNASSPAASRNPLNAVGNTAVDSYTKKVSPSSGLEPRCPLCNTKLCITNLASNLTCLNSLTEPRWSVLGSSQLVSHLDNLRTLPLVSL